MSVQTWSCDKCPQRYESPVIVAAVDHHCPGPGSRVVRPYRLELEQSTLPAEYLTGWVDPVVPDAQGAVLR